jgi:peptidoglycan LD-endopeptidase CwlK
MASRLVSDLDPRIQQGVREIQRAWADAGHVVILTCTYRSPAEQDALYAQGRTLPGKVVTHAKGGESLHNRGLAVDFLPIVNGKAEWNDLLLFHDLAKMAIALDPHVSWGGSWPEPRTDADHLQWNLPPA